MKEPSSYRSIAVLAPIHDGRHALGADALARESIPYVISLPEQQLGAFVYTWVNREHRAGSICVIYGPGLDTPAIVEATDDVPMAPEFNFDDWQVGALELRQDLKLASAQLRVRGARVQMDARFQALHPAYAYGSHEQGCPDYAATNRFEQAGRLQGTLCIDGRELQFDTTGARDHSWGTRDWQTPQHWKWLHAQAGDDCCVHFWQIQARGNTDLRGYVFRDGLMAEVEQVEVSYKGDLQYRQTELKALVRDHAGRLTVVDAQCFAHYPLQPDPATTLNEAAMRCRIDGRPGQGWSEFMWPSAYLAHLRSRAFYSFQP